MPSNLYGSGGQESLVIKIGDTLKLTSFEDLYEDLPGLEECLDEELGLFTKPVKELYALDRRGAWTKVTELTKMRRLEDLQYLRINGGDPLLITANHPIIVSNDEEDVIRADESTRGAHYRQFRDAMESLTEYEGNISCLDVDFMQHKILNSYCYDGGLEHHSCKALIDLDEGVKLSMFGYFIGLFLCQGHFIRDQWGELRAVSVECDTLGLAERIAKGVYDATGASMDVVSHINGYGGVLLFSDNQGLIKLMAYKLGLREEPWDRRLPPDILNYPRTFKLGVFLGYMNGNPDEVEEYANTIHSNGRAFSNQFSTLARSLGYPGKAAFNEQPKQYALPKCGYYVRESSKEYDKAAVEEWNVISSNYAITNTHLLRKNEYVYGIKTESHSFLMNNTWMYAG